MQQKEIIDSENILARLKCETEQAHLETENQIPIEKPDFSIADYCRLLGKFYAFYQIFEPEIEKAIAAQKIEFNYRERLKTPKLSADLRNLGIDEKAFSEMRGKVSLPTLDSAESIFGALYVVEGSTLGGQVISRQLKEKFGVDEANGAEFFNGYGKQTGKMWNDFRAAILNFAETDSKHDEIIESAADTFKKFGLALGEN